MSEPTTLTALLQTLESDGEGPQLSLGEVVAVIGERGYGPLVLMLALIAALPTGAVPGVPSVCGISIALVSMQLVFGKRYPWLPARMRRLAIERQHYARVADRITPWTRRLDRLVRPRLHWFTHGLATRVIGLACVALGLCMIPLEVLPFAAAAPATGIAMMGLGLTGKDGFWVLAGLAPAGLGLWFLFKLFG
ncbi:exopolysaccharide biosynthesis protein [Salinisphaera aquimarina]|uniref:Exopolysaccharide biosynthesis protein n=1 Tax=Salinisphaera aquimarina TaxID=2094031 RepID=A0ABV7ET54_9GAMM